MTKQYIPKIRFQGFDDEWETYLLDKLLNWSKGKGLKKDSLNTDGIGYPTVHYADLYKFKEIESDVIHWTEEKLQVEIPNNSILFPMSDVTPIGLARTTTLLKEGVTAGGDVLIGELVDYIHSIFLSYSINSNYKNILPLVTGTTVKHISSKSLSKLNISLPSLPEQESIGQLFRTLDELISAYKENIEQYQSLKTSMLSKMFPKEGQKQPEIRLDGFDGDWEEREFVNILKVNSGRDYKHLELGDIPVYGTGGYMISVNKSLSENDAIGIGRKGTIDKPFMLKAPFWTVDTLFYVTSDCVELSFLYLVFQGISWKKFDESTGVPSLSKRTIEKINKLFPSLPEQEAIGAFFANLDETISSYQNKMGQLELFKNRLLQDLFI